MESIKDQESKYRFVDLTDPNVQLRENYNKVILRKELLITSTPIKNSNESSIKPENESTGMKNGKINTNIFCPKPFSSINSSLPKPRKEALDSNKPLVDRLKKPFSTNSSSSLMSSLKKNEEPSRKYSPKQKPIVPPKPKNLKEIIGEKKKNGITSSLKNNSSLINNTISHKNIDKLNNVEKTENNYVGTRFQNTNRKSSEFQDLVEQKALLRRRLLSKIILLREEEDELRQEKSAIDSRGNQIHIKIEKHSTDEADKLSQLIIEIIQITKLKTSLEQRLTKSHNEIQNKQSELTDDIKKRHSKLKDQIWEANSLQKNTDRRMENLRRVLCKRLNDDITEFDVFISDLIRITKELKELEQQIQVGEEQLKALND